MWVERVGRTFLSDREKVLYLKLVNASDTPQPLTVDAANAMNGLATMYSLHAATRWTTNTIDRPDMIHPVMSKIPVTAKAWHHAVPANTIEVIDIPLH